MSSAPFTHTPRPAIVPDSRPDQRYFGADSHAATCGIPNNSGRRDATATVGVERIGHMPGAARLAVDSMPIDGFKPALISKGLRRRQERRVVLASPASSQP